MKKSILALLIAAPLALTLSGCVIKINDDGIDHGFVSDSEDRAYNNRKKIANVQLGASFMDMQGKLGVADFSETYTDSDDTVRVLYYRTQRKHKDGLTTKDECTFLQFINGKLVETGNGGDYLKNKKIKAN
ncbi:DUF3192 domain-containing protein [Colwellia sp. TT2012]|uniref:DUF3192 domain-containing protein n=1 Tax=Colwellia sp. TT2012 TaxID=1720342 RepID=UPI00070DB1CA|nr:DUF3192 domain-containing protein [Colwellia sp. TT2012]